MGDIIYDDPSEVGCCCACTLLQSGVVSLIHSLGPQIQEMQPFSLRMNNLGHSRDTVLKDTHPLTSLLPLQLTNQRNNLLSPLDSALKGELKGVKGDLKRPFDKAAKDYDTKFVKIEKERKQQVGRISFGVGSRLWSVFINSLSH